jgi:membrane associated rhomboid family serine protease
MIIPVGHESDTVRRLPWITFGIIGICFLVHIFISTGINRDIKAAEGSAQKLVEYYFEHPYLELNPDVRKLLFGDRNSEAIENQLDAYRNMMGYQIPTTAQLEQEWLDKLSMQLLEILNGVTYRKWGYIPAERKTSGLITYMFIHGGWLHLLGNLLLLYLMGPFIEDVWGRPIFAAFYLVMGISSAAIYGLHYPNLQGPLIGASGAIAGVMGAFLIRYLKTRITFFYFFFFIVRGTFEAPAWLILPLWLGLQIFNAKILDMVNPDGGGGVAYWAHVWGFVLGAAVAYGIKVLKIEEKYIHPKIEAKIDTGDEIPNAINTIIKRKNAGRIGEAFALMLDLLKKAPPTPEMLETLWNLGTQIGLRYEYEEFFIPLIEKEIRRGYLDSASRHYRRLKDELPNIKLNLTYKIALIEFLSERGEFQEARQLAGEALEEITPETPSGVLLKFTLVALKLKIPQIQKAIEICRQHPEMMNEQREMLNKRLEEIQAMS